MNKISIIVPAYNVAPYIERCLDSIINQTYKNLEIIVIDDGSTDETLSIMNEYAKKDSRIKVIHQNNVGLVQTRENGIGIASGDFVTFVDSDDYIELNMYEKLINNMIEYNADISHCGVNFCFADSKNVPHYGTQRIIVQDNFTGLKDLLEGIIIEPALWNKLYKRDLLYNSCLDISILNNEDLLRNFVLFSRSNRSVYEDFCGYQYVQREGSMSKDSSKSIEISKHIIKARKVIADNSNESVKPFAIRCWLNAIVNDINHLTFSKQDEVKKYCKEIRKVLFKERKNIGYLIKRQQLAAWLIIISPLLHRFVYSIYKKVNYDKK